MRRNAIGAACLLALLAGVFSIGACSSDPITVTVTVPTDKIPADGKSAANIEVKIIQGDTVMNSGTVTFSSSLDSSSFTEIEDPTEKPSAEERKTDATVSAGMASAQLYAMQPGTASVVVSYVDDLSGATAPPQTAVVRFGSESSDSPEIGRITFVSAEPPVLQLKGSGGNESSRVTFQVFDKSNSPMTGVEITFELGSDMGGATLSDTTAKSGENGMVSTNLNAGTSGASGIVKAYSSDRKVSGESTPITVAGSGANYRNFSFVCTRKAIGGFQDTGLTMQCSAHLADRSGLKIANQQVTFLVEAGSIDPVATTDETGTAVAVYKTQDPQPADVEPNLAYMPDFLLANADREPSQACATNPSKTCNPRDGLVTVVAYTTGEEEWIDADQDGEWDAGEDWTDLSEPYADVNDNGQFDANDPQEKDYYRDVNPKNGHFDRPNGQWDAATQIWKATKFVWTGGVDERVSGFYNPDTKQRISRIELEHCAPAERIYLRVLDQNMNSLATQEGDTMSCSCGNGECYIEPADFGLNDDKFGNKFMPVNPLRVLDGHTCSPDCKLEDPPCEAMNGVLNCAGSFGTSEEGGYIEVQVPIDISVL